MSEIIQIIADIMKFISEIINFISLLMILFFGLKIATSKIPVHFDEQRAQGYGINCTFKNYMGDNEIYLGDN